MTEEVIKLSMNVEDATKSIKRMTDEMEDFKKEVQDSLEGIKETTEKGVKGFSKLTNVVKGVGKGFQGIGLAIKAVGFALIIKLVDKLTESLGQNQQVADAVNTVFKTIQIVLNQVSQVFIDVFKSVSEATGGFDALQKVLGGALSLSINLVVGAIQGLVLGVKNAQLAWEKSFFGDKDPETIKNLEAEIESLGNKLDQTGNRISEAGGNIKDGFIEAVEEVGTLASGVATAVGDALEKVNVKQAIEQAKTIVQAEKNYELLALQQQRLIEDYDRQAEEQRQLRDNESATIEDRIKANEELGRILQEQGDAEKETINLRIKAIQDRIKAEGESVELSNELYTLNTELIAVEAKLTGLRSEQLTNTNALKKESLELANTEKEVENEIAISRAQFDAERELSEVTRIQKLQEALALEKEIELQRVQAQIDANKIGTQAYADATAEKLRLEEDYRQREQTLKDESVLAEENLKQQKLQIIGSTFGAISDILGANSKAGKAAAIAQAVINSYLGFTEVLASPTTIPEPFGSIQKGVSAASILASGLATVKQITSTKLPQGDVGGGGAPSAPPSFNIVGASSENQLAEAIGGQQQKPVKAFVVSSDVSSAQSLDRNIIEEASI